MLQLKLVFEYEKHATETEWNEFTGNSYDLGVLMKGAKEGRGRNRNYKCL